MWANYPDCFAWQGSENAAIKRAMGRFSGPEIAQAFLKQKLLVVRPWSEHELPWVRGSNDQPTPKGLRLAEPERVKVIRAATPLGLNDVALTHPG